MQAIDADTHVDENDETWSYMSRSEQRYRPVLIRVPGQKHAHWVYDGMLRQRTIRDDQKDGTTAETRELLDIAARLRDMDRMGVSTQIVYSTFFAQPITDRAEVEYALRRSYNRWLAERCSHSNGRLRWIVVPPLLSMDRAIEEVRWAKEHGAVGILKKGDEEAGHWPSESYFFPLYEEAERLDLPITFHVGSGTTFGRGLPPGTAYGGGTPVIHAFQSLITRGVPLRFPKLRWGFIEANASWLPYVVYNLRHFVQTVKERPNVGGQTGEERINIAGSILETYNFYVSCQEDEDLRAIIAHVGEDYLLIGSDYTHNDFSSQLAYTNGLRERASKGDISQSAVQKIMCDTPRRFYGL
jgi:predicted TIM-barrel fold metal-dependent hydrolase